MVSSSISCISSIKRVFHLALVIIVILESFGLDARVIPTGCIHDHAKLDKSSIQSAKRDLVRLFQKLDITSIVPNASQEKFVLDLIESNKLYDEPESEETSDEEEFDIVFYINPKLVEQLTGGPGYRPISDKTNKAKS